jgi:hypothetical protein
VIKLWGLTEATAPRKNSGPDGSSFDQSHWYREQVRFLIERSHKTVTTELKTLALLRGASWASSGWTSRQLTPYFHNGAAARLDEIVNFYNLRFQMGLTDDQKRALVAFLNSL